MTPCSMGSRSALGWDVLSHSPTTLLSNFLLITALFCALNGLTPKTASGCLAQCLPGQQSAFAQGLAQSNPAALFIDIFPPHPP